MAFVWHRPPWREPEAPLHFAVRFTREVGNTVDADPGRESFVRRRERAVRRWWDKHGCELYLVGAGKVEGEENELVHKAEGSEKNGEVCPAGWNKGKPGMTATTEGVAAYLAKNAKKL